MSQEMITDITLDHLPDLSESSVSFQIPPDNSSAEFLLDSTDGFDLLCRVTDDEASFVPPPYRGPPLMLSELTPKAESISRPPPQSRTPGPSSSESSQLAQPLALGNPSRDDCRKTPSRSRSKLMDIAFDSPVSEERREQLPAKVETFGRDHEIPTHVGMDFAAHAKEAAVFLLNPVPALRPKTELNPRTNSKPTVVDGGISKIPAPMKAHVSKMTKNKLSSVYVTPASPPFTASQSSLSQSTDIDTEKQLVPPASTDDDIRKPADNTQITLSSTSAMAERLVSYSQKLISSIGLYQPRSGNSFTEDSNDLASPDDAGVRTRPSAAVRPPSILLLSSSNYIPGANDEPLRLSEISPRKAPPHDPQNTSASRASQDGQQRAMSPMRPGKKRSSTGAGSSSQEYHRRKKGKTVLPSAEFERGSSQEEECSIAQPYTDKNMHHEGQPIMNSEAREDPRNSGFPKSTLPNTRTKYRPKLNSSQHKGPTLQAFPHLSNLRQVHGTITKGKGKYAEEQPKVPTTRSVSSLNSFSASSRSRHHPTKVEWKNWHSVRARERSGPSSTVDLPLFEKKPNATLSASQPTKPVAFTFRVDARLEARKAEEKLATSEQARSHHSHVVPDFRALHESHQAALACRKENHVQSGSVPFFFSTEQRAKEREKFDEVVRRKEEEMQRMREDQRRLEAEEEERAIKELRRKAIPKANEIPEWYADMPKRKGTAV